MPRCAISFGANIGDAAATVRDAAGRLCDALCQAQPSRFHLSSLYETPPVGGPSGQAPFINAVAALETSASPLEVWSTLRRVEAELGRTRSRRWEARKIDLDVLLYEDVRIWTPQLKIPHPRMCMRRFMILPAREVAADFTDPVSGLSMAALADRLEQRGAAMYLHARDWQFAELIARRLIESGPAVATKAPQGCPPDAVPPVGGPSRWVYPVGESPVWPGSPGRGGAFGDGPAPLPPFLHVVLCPPRKPAPAAHAGAREGSIGPEWELRHLDLARRLGLTGDGRPVAALEGEPRYLLPTDDLDWALHELRAALDAMACPIRRL